MQSIIKLLKIIKEQYEFDLKSGYDKSYLGDVNFYLNETITEINEVKNELKLNNSVYLEDELGDVIWNYFNFLNLLQEKGYIESLENVFNNCFLKYEDRIKFKLSSNGYENKKSIQEILDISVIKWREIKQKQKEELQKKHNLKYNI